MPGGVNSVLLVTASSESALPHLPDLAATVHENVPEGASVHWRIEIDSPDTCLTDRVVGIPLLAAPWISVHVTGRTRGPAIARNIAVADRLRTSDPDVVVNVDADDLLLPGGLAVLVTSLRRNLSVGWSAGGNTRFGDATGVRETFAPGGGLSGIVGPGAVWDAWQSTGVFPLAAAVVAYRTSTLVRVGGWPATPTGEDAALLVAVSDREPGWVHTRPIFEYRQHPGQSTGTDVHRALRPLTWDMIGWRRPSN